MQNSGELKSYSDRPQSHLMHRFGRHLGEFVESSGELKIDAAKKHKYRINKIQTFGSKWQILPNV